MEANLPIPDTYKNTARGAESPISSSTRSSRRATRTGVQTIAFNLPNDEKVREAKGTKKVMLRNICRAKFDKILVPIAGQVMAPELIPYVTFDAYFNEILLHEFSHGLGPGTLRLPDGTEVGRAADLRGLEELLHSVPGESLSYHGERNHFSNWLKARTEFLLAYELRPRKVSDYRSVEDIRRYLIGCIRDLGTAQQQGNIVDFDPQTFDPQGSFARIGGGSLGASNAPPTRRSLQRASRALAAVLFVPESMPWKSSLWLA